MEISDKLIQRFFRKECTPEEADFVASFLKQHPDYWIEHFSQQEYEAIAPEHPDDYMEDWEAWEKLQQKIRKERNIKTIQRLAVAASIALVSVLGIRFLYQQQQPNTTKPGEIVSNIISDDGTRSIVNESDSIMMVDLADGTKVRLSSGSSLRFDDSAWKIKRDIELIGEASFYVAKDKTRPFTVYCGQVATMALGTIFSVKQNNRNDSLRVRLFEGKVRVRKLHYQPGVDSTDLMKPAFLIPGQEILFAPGNNLAVLRNFMPTALPKYIVKNKSITEARSLPASTWVEFNNQPLSDVFVSLEVLYNVEINYNRHDIRNVSFIGRFEPYDNIDEILEIIARLNKLTVVKKGANQYLVKKT